MGYQPKDYFFRKAKDENYVARSVYKLKELDETYGILRAGQRVLDLGASPGSWTQYAMERLGPQGTVVAVDLKPLHPQFTKDEHLRRKNPEAPRKWAFLEFHQGDVMEIFKKCPGGEVQDGSHSLQWISTDGLQEFDVILSDMAPQTTGIRLTDQTRSLELCEMALEVASRTLRKGGHLVVKFFHSGDFLMFKKKMGLHFQRVEALRPEGTRRASKEIFLVGLKYNKN